MSAAPGRAAATPVVGAVPAAPGPEANAPATDIDPLAFEVPAERAPWHVRNSRSLIAAAATGGVLLAGTLGYGVWRNLAATPLDQIEMPAPSETIGGPELVTAPSKVESAAREARVPRNDVADKRPVSPSQAADSGAATTRASTYSGRGVTHTRPEATPPGVPPSREANAATSNAPPSRSPAQPAFSSRTCPDAVAALGLCAPGPTETDK